jgi:hypothetical protein
MLDEVESWRSRLTPASFEELVEDCKRRCLRAPKDVAVAQSPAEQTIDMEQVISDRVHASLRHGTDARSGVQPDYGQVESPHLIEPEQTPRPPQRFHFPWKFVSSQLTNSKGDEIFYPVNDERDRQWARRLEWVIGHHLDRAEDDLEELHADYLAVLRESREAHERKYDQEHIAELNKRLEATNKSLREFRAHGYCK